MWAQGCFFAFEQFQVVDIPRAVRGRDKTDFVAHVVKVENVSQNDDDDHEVSTRHVIAWPITRLHAPTVLFRPCYGDMEFPIRRSVNACVRTRWYLPTSGYSPVLFKEQNNVFDGLEALISARGVCDNKTGPNSSALDGNVLFNREVTDLFLNLPYQKLKKAVARNGSFLWERWVFLL